MAQEVVGQKRPEEPIFQHYLSLLDNGTKPDLAKLTIARQIASQPAAGRLVLP